MTTGDGSNSLDQHGHRDQTATGKWRKSEQVLKHTPYPQRAVNRNDTRDTRTGPPKCAREERGAERRS